MKIPHTRRRKQTGFTLIEMMIAATIFGLVTIALVAFTLDSARGMFWASNKSKITHDVRNFTLRITTETLGARAAIVYPSFALTDRDSDGDVKRSGESGDCLVLVYHDRVQDNPADDYAFNDYYTKIVVFFRRADADGISPVYRAESTFTPPILTSDPASFEALLEASFPSDSGDYPVVLELSRGLANGQLFRNFGNGSYVVNGEILHGNKVKEITNTYNLTISPRG